MMIEGGLILLVLFRQRDPGLNAVHVGSVAPRIFQAFAMCDALAGDHPVDLARTDLLRKAEAVAMRDRAAVEIRHRGKADVGMRLHIELARDARREFQRPHMVEKYERAHHAAIAERKDASDFEAAAQVAGSSIDKEFNHRAVSA